MKSKKATSSSSSKKKIALPKVETLESLSYALRRTQPSRFSQHKGLVAVRNEYDKDGYATPCKANFYCFTLRVKRMKMEKYRDEEGKMQIRNREYLDSQRYLPVNVEIADYIMHLKPISTRLLFYILSFKIDYTTNFFKCNEQLIMNFISYCQHLRYKADKRTDEESPISEITVKKALRNLVDNNVITNVTRLLYMVNPMVACLGSLDVQTQRLNEYAQHLIKKDDVVDFCIMPVIK